MIATSPDTGRVPFGSLFDLKSEVQFLRVGNSRGQAPRPASERSAQLGGAAQGCEPSSVACPIGDLAQKGQEFVGAQLGRRSRPALTRLVSDARVLLRQLFSLFGCPVHHLSRS